jgi:hypothetical protein
VARAHPLLQLLVLADTLSAQLATHEFRFVRSYFLLPSRQALPSTSAFAGSALLYLQPLPLLFPKVSYFAELCAFGREGNRRSMKGTHYGPDWRCGTIA